MKIQLAAVIIALCLLLSSCAGQLQPMAEKQYTATFLTLFDTVTTIKGSAESEEDFGAQTQEIHDALLYYHRLFDIYNSYDGMNNLCTVNAQAGTEPVEVEPAILELLKDCKSYYELTEGKVNVAMGSVLQLWHDAREDGVNDPVHAALPAAEALESAAAHMDLDKVILDEAASTVQFADPEIRLDVGAVAKGWATQRVAEEAPAGMLISVGGNVCATGPKDAEGTPWIIGIQNPDGGDENLHSIYVTEGTVVTSGDYQRTFTVDGQKYHHIIDPETRMPSSWWRSVTIVCDDSGLADALSTALFLMPLEEGKALAEGSGAEAFWVAPDGTEYMTSGFENMIRT